MPRKPDLKQIDNIVKDLELSKEQRRMLHEEISGQGLTLDEIKEIARQIKQIYPGK